MTGKRSREENEWDFSRGQKAAICHGTRPQKGLFVLFAFVLIEMAIILLPLALRVII